MAPTHDITPIVTLHHCQPATATANQQQNPTASTTERNTCFPAWVEAITNVPKSLKVILKQPKPISHRFLISKEDIMPFNPSYSYLAYSSTASLLPPEPQYMEDTPLEAATKVIVFETWKVLKPLPNGVKFQNGMQVIIQGPRWGSRKIIFREGFLGPIIGWAKHWVCVALVLPGRPSFEEPDCNIAVLIPCTLFDFSRKDTCYYFCNKWRMQKVLAPIRYVIELK
jgi:hypothetical protein